MFFVQMRDGEVRPQLFSPAEPPVGEHYARELADAAATGSAYSVAFVSEGSGGTPEGAAHDVLLVAAIDRAGETFAIETTLLRGTDGTVEPGESRIWGNDFVLNVFDGVRAAWGLARRRDLGYGLSAEMPAGWVAHQEQRMTELRPPSDNAAAHISVYGRRTIEPVRPGEARSFVERFPPWQEARERIVSDERHEGDELVATGSCVSDDGRHRVEIGVRVSTDRAIVFSYNDDGSEDELLEAARSIFNSIRSHEQAD